MQCLMLRRAIASAAILFASATAHAQLFRAYVASTGNDANPCTLVAPCRLLPAALTAVAEGGEIWMLDSANYNTTTVVVAKAVTILAPPGVVGSVVGNGSNAISVTAVLGQVTLRNLVIVPVAGVLSGHGILKSGASRLVLEGVTVAGMPNDGIRLSEGDLAVHDSILRDNANGLVMQAGRAIVSRTQVTGNASWGLSAQADASETIRLDVIDCVVSFNHTGIRSAAGGTGGAAYVNVRGTTASWNVIGFFATSISAGATAALTLRANQATSNEYGVRLTNAGARALVSQNFIATNETGLHNSAALLETDGTNVVRNNLTAQSVGTLTPVTPTL